MKEKTAAPTGRRRDVRGRAHPLDLLRQVRTHELLLERAAHYIRPGASVVDVGCATGLLLERLPADCRYTGLEDRPELLALAKRRYAGRPHARFLAYGPGTPDFGERVNVAVLLDTVHRAGTGAVGLLRAACRSLAPGGRIIVSGPATAASLNVIGELFACQLAAKGRRLDALMKSWRGERASKGYFCSAEGMAALLGLLGAGRILEAGHDIHYGHSFFVVASRWNRDVKPARREATPLTLDPHHP